MTLIRGEDSVTKSKVKVGTEFPHYKRTRPFLPGILPSQLFMIPRKHPESTGPAVKPTHVTFAETRNQLRVRPPFPILSHSSSNTAVV